MTRRELKRASVLIACLWGCTRAEQPITDSATMFRGGASHAGVYDADLRSGLLGMQWRFDTDGGVISSPVIRRDTVWVGSSDGRMYALSLTTGDLFWRYDLSTPISSSPALVGDVVVVGSRHGRFNGLNAHTGEPLWSLETGADLPLPWGHESGDRFTSSPAIAGALAVVGSGDGTVRAIEWRTGNERWQAEIGTRIRSSPAIADGRVYIGGIDGRLYALELASGRKLWAYETEGVTLKSGEWGFDRRTIQSSPAVRNGTVYFGARDGFLYAISADSGTLRWRFDHKISWIISSPAVTDSEVYAGSSDGAFLQALDARTGVERWRLGTNSIVWSSPAIAGGVLVVGDGRGRVLGVDRGSGKLLWEFFTGGQVFSSPVPAGRELVVGSLDGGIYALCTADPAESVERAVYPGRRGTPTDSLAGVITTALTARGYRSVDDSQLVATLTAALADGRPTTVVFASDVLPPEIVGEPFEQSLLRRFLEAGGKAVWTSVPPLLWPRDSSGQRIPSLAQLAWDRPAQVLGVSHSVAIFDRRSAQPTSTGVRWGLSGRWRDAWAIDSQDASEVLAKDDWGLAAAWVRSFGGPPGTGFVRVSPHDPQQIYLAAEYRPGCS